LQLNLPILDCLENSQNILIAGAGGGFDVFSGLPIYFALRKLGKTAHLANLSFCDFRIIKHVCRFETIIEEALAVTWGGVRELPLPYMPEPLLSQWFQEKRGESIPIWLFGRLGAKPYIAAYQSLAEKLNFDAIILVDGGVDSIMRGDEEGAGTLIEDTLTLIAVDALNTPVKILACIGFGAEREEAVCHYRALENMAALAKADAFLGGCALTKQMEDFQLFESACRYVWEHPGHSASHISTRIIPATWGEFGNYHMTDQDQWIDICISPLMSLYWFYNATTVTRCNLLADILRDTTTKDEAMRSAMMSPLGRARTRRPLPY